MKLEGYQPPRWFTGTGCTCAPNTWRGVDLRPACRVHDWEYLLEGGERERLAADRHLRRNLRLLGAPWWLAWSFYVGVRVGGAFAFEYRREPGLAWRVFYAVRGLLLAWK